MTCSITPTNSLFMGGRTMRRATRWLTVAAALRRPNGSAVGAHRMWCSGERDPPPENHAMSLASERVMVLPRLLGSKGDTELALKPLVVAADGGERLNGGVSQRQLSSHHDDEVQVTEAHMCD